MNFLLLPRLEGFEIYSTLTTHTCIHDHLEHKRLAACKDLKSLWCTMASIRSVKGVQMPDLEFSAVVFLKFLDNLALKIKIL